MMQRNCRNCVHYNKEKYVCEVSNLRITHRKSLKNYAISCAQYKEIEDDKE